MENEMRQYYVGYYDYKNGSDDSDGIDLRVGNEVTANSSREALEAVRDESLFGDVIAGHFIMATLLGERAEDEAPLVMDSLVFWG
jgi:hypothetical protein